MPLISIYECLCDETRLRIIHLLTHGPLCVCHLQAVLDAPQARISQHLAYLRKREMVESQRHGTWMIYALPEHPSPELSKHLACLQDYAATSKKFQDDLTKLRSNGASCPSKPQSKPKSKLALKS